MDFRTHRPQRGFGRSERSLAKIAEDLTRFLTKAQRSLTSETLHLSRSWLRVFRSANTAHLGASVSQERSPRVAPSAKYVARRGSVEDGMRMITACCAHALQRYMSR